MTSVLHAFQEIKIEDLQQHEYFLQDLGTQDESVIVFPLPYENFKVINSTLEEDS